MVDNTTIQIIVQSGVVGLMLVFGYGGYRLGNKVLDLFGNHLLTELRLMREAVEKLVEKLSGQ